MAQVVAVARGRAAWARATTAERRIKGPTLRWRNGAVNGSVWPRQATSHNDDENRPVGWTARHVKVRRNPTQNTSNARGNEAGLKAPRNRTGPHRSCARTSADKSGNTDRHIEGDENVQTDARISLANIIYMYTHAHARHTYIHTLHSHTCVQSIAR